MRIERYLTTPTTPDAARVQIAAYLEQARYEVVSTEPVLRYHRGSPAGSMFSFSPRNWQVQVRLDVKPSPEGARVYVLFDIDTRWQLVIARERRFWEEEVDGLVAAIGGRPVDVTAPEGQAVAQQFGLPGAQQVHDQQLANQVKSGANWFYWIAGMSIINSIAYRLGLEITFLIGLTGTAFVEGIGIGISQQLPESANLIMAVALVAEILVASIFVLIGALARKGLRWAFILGLVFYVLDAVIWLAFREWLPAAFHLLGLFGILSGLRALGSKQAGGPTA